MKKYILLVLMTLSMGILAQNSENLTLMARWATGPCRAIYSTSDALYMGNGSYLDILDASDYGSRLSRYEFPGLIQDIFYQSFKIYVAVENAGVYILKTSNGGTITSPALVGSWTSTGSVRRIAYQDGYVYVADGNTGFSIVRTSDFEYMGHLQFSSPVQDVFVLGDYAYLAVDALGMLTIDISNPAAPAVLDTADTPGKAYGVSVRGTTAFVADREQGVWLVNVTNPSSIQVTDQWAVDPNSITLSDITVDVGGETAYLSDEGYGLRILDLTTMLQKTTLNTQGDALSLFIDQNYVYLADGIAGMQKIDVAVVPPDAVNSVLAGGSALDVIFTDNYTYVAGGEGGVWILSHEQLNDGQVSLLTHIDTQNAQGLALTGNVLLIADGPGGLLFYNVTDPEVPGYIEKIITQNEMLDVTVLGENAYVAEGSSGIRRVDITNPLEPVSQGIIEGSNTFRSVGVNADERSNRVYVSADTNGMKILDVNSQSITGTYKNQSHTQHVGIPVSGSEVVYLADGSNGLIGLNVSNIESISQIDQYNTEGWAYDVNFYKDIAVVADGQSTIRLIDTSNEEELNSIGSYHTAGTSYNVDVSGDTLVIADGDGGIYYLKGEFTGTLEMVEDSLEFGNVVLGKNRTIYIPLVNTGSSAVLASEMTGKTGRFYASALPQWIAAGDTGYIGITFVPNAYTTLYDTLSLETDATNSPHILPVVGTGVQTIPLTAYTADLYTYALYHMDALTGSTLEDESLYGYLDGNVAGATVSNENGGYFGQGLVFNESDVVNINLESLGMLPSLEKWHGFTIETWFKLSTIPQGKAILYQFAEGSRILFELSVKGNQLMALAGVSVQEVDTLLSDAETPLVTGEWYHAALTVGEYLKLYLNGNLEDQEKANVPLPTGPLTTTVGNDPALEYPFNGVMDEMRLSSITREPWEFNVSTGRIQVNTDPISFGNVYINKTKYYYLTIRNSGAGTLFVDSIYVKTGRFNVSNETFNLVSNGQQPIWLAFTPDAAQTFRDTLTIHSQDLLNPTVRIPLYGSGFQTVSTEAYTSDIYTSGLWHLDGTVDMDSIPDASGNGLVGYFRGAGISWYTLFKKYGTSSLRFTGDTSWVRIPYNSIFNYTSSPFSLETWFSLAGKPSGKNYYVLFRRGDGSNLQYEVLYGDTLTTGKGLVVRFYGSNNQIYNLYGPPTSEMDLNQWYQMAVTWDRNKFRLYLNGVAVDSTDFTGTLRSSNADLSMGSDYGSGHGFNGYLDEIRFSNIDRQPEEFNVGLPNIYLSIETLNFDTTFVGSTNIRTFSITNTGAVPLIIDSTTTRTEIFSFTPESGTLSVSESVVITGQFNPDTVGAVRDTLRIYSNDPDIPVFEVPLNGLGIDYRPRSPYAVDQNTIALYHCDGTNVASVTDATGKHNGTFTGTRTDTAYFAKGLRFDGKTSYLSIADHDTLRIDMAKKSYTIECFFKTDTVNQVIFFKDPYQSGTNTKGNYGLSIDTDGNLALYGFGTGPSYVADGVWHHVAFVYAANTRLGTLYLDGSVELQKTWQTGTTDVVTPGNLLFGARETSVNQRTGFFQGKMDEIRISNIARPEWDLIFKSTGISASISGISTKGAQQTVNITVPASDGTGKEVWLYYRQGGRHTYSRVQATYTNTTLYKAIIPADSVTERGLEYYIELTVSGKTYYHPLYDYYNHPITQRVRFNALSADTTLPKKKYMMISVPANLDHADAGSVLLDDFNNIWNPYEWRCLTWKDTTYWEYTDSSTTYADTLVLSFDQGRAFWIISANQKAWDVNAGYSCSTESPYAFSARPQWNMVGSPFAFPVDWNDCALTSPKLETLYYYDGKGYRLDWPVFEPWCGYWIYNADVYYHELNVPPREKSTLAKGNPVRGGVLEALDKQDWVWQLSARTENAEDLDNFFGVRQQSIDEWDLRDRVEPPPMGDYVSVFFENSDWKNHPGAYAADIRSNNSEGYTWDVSVESRLEKTAVKLSWILHQSMPETWQVRLIDPEQGIAIDMLSKNEYTIVTSKTLPNVTLLKCIAGSPEYVDEQVKVAMVPVEFHLYQNYPNPFNPATLIKYSLPKNGHVKVTIFNMLGQQVMKLVDQEQQSGEHEVHWNGINDRGAAVSSGVYFYRLDFPGRVAIRKMILVR